MPMIELVTGKKTLLIHFISGINFLKIYRVDCFESTLVHLTERFNGKDLYLIGTMNSSTMLAQRTQKLIEEIAPDAVYVQTNKR
jgi:hypothetical protein